LRRKYSQVERLSWHYQSLTSQASMIWSWRTGWTCCSGTSRSEFSSWLLYTDKAHKHW
jgi:hypothetical protein